MIDRKILLKRLKIVREEIKELKDKMEIQKDFEKHYLRMLKEVKNGKSTGNN